MALHGDGQTSGARMAEAGQQYEAAAAQQANHRMSGVKAAAEAALMMEEDEARRHGNGGGPRIVESDAHAKKQEKKDAKKDEMTLAKLFFSGADGVEMHSDGPDGGQMTARRSWRQGNDEGEGQMEPIVMLDEEFIPDPPCVMPFEDDDDDADEAAHAAQSVQLYWKTYASWLECWPKVKETREDMLKFENAKNEQKISGKRCRSYVVVSQQAVGVRATPEMEGARTGDVCRPGQCVFVDELKEKDGCRFLHLYNGSGWLFDQKDGVQVMTEMKSLETGMWWYRIVCQEFVEVRRNPTMGAECRNGWVMCPKEVAVVRTRCRVGGYQFMQLADGRGWVFELKPGTAKNCKDPGQYVMRQCDDDFIVGSEAAYLKRLVPPTDEVVEVGMWTYIVARLPVLAIGTHRNGTYLSAGDIVKVDKRAVSGGLPQVEGVISLMNRRWLRLADRRGWVPETAQDGTVLMEYQKDQEVSYPGWYQGQQKNAEKPKEDWMSGFV